VRLYLRGTAAANGPIFHPLGDICGGVEPRWKDNVRRKPLLLWPPQIPDGLPGERIRASAVKNRSLTACAMAQPVLCLNVLLCSMLHRTTGWLQIMNWEGGSGRGLLWSKLLEGAEKRYKKHQSGQFGTVQDSNSGLRGHKTTVTTSQHCMRKDAIYRLNKLQETTVCGHCGRLISGSESTCVQEGRIKMVSTGLLRHVVW
jgi:hypothetical protein